MKIKRKKDEGSLKEIGGQTTTARVFTFYLSLIFFFFIFFSFFLYSLAPRVVSSVVVITTNRHRQPVNGTVSCFSLCCFFLRPPLAAPLMPLSERGRERIYNNKTDAHDSGAQKRITNLAALPGERHLPLQSGNLVSVQD